MIEPIAVYYEHCAAGWKVPRSRTTNRIAVLVVEGEAAFDTEQGLFRLGKGDMLYMPAGIEREAWNAPKETHEMYVAHFHYAGDGEGVRLLGAERVCAARPPSGDYARNRFAALTQYWLRQSAGRPALCHAVLLELLALLGEAAEADSLQGVTSSLVYRLEAYILQHYREPVTVRELAAHVGKTPNYISSLYRKATRRTLTAYLQQIRIAAACDLLMRSQMNIGEISDYLGFCEQSYFNKVFRNITGSAPSAYVRHQVVRQLPLAADVVTEHPLAHPRTATRGD
ncbi:MAG: helix-turn-helix domain-containing protein [Paenibacillaceae bacterium]|nr:helix-turn-helix domain-containing protein [Paenibacillaceae bacterium]